jgi:hypothetical protein
MRGAVGQQPQQPQQQQQGYSNGGVMPHQGQPYGQGQFGGQQQQQPSQLQQPQQQGGLGSRRTTPTTPQFSPATPVMGVHDCLQANGGKPLYLCQP